MNKERNVCEMDIQVVDGRAMVSSLALAKRFRKRHDNVLRAIDGLKVDAEFRALNFEESKYLDVQGKVQPMFFLTKDGFVLLVMGFTGKEAMKFKLAYIAAFNKMEDYIRANLVTNTPPLLEWGHARLEGKVARKSFTDVIRDHLIPYAISRGSKNYSKFYINYSKLLNLYLEDDDFKVPSGSNIRDCLSAGDLLVFKKMEEGMAKMMQDEIQKGTDYKEIYQKCKYKMLSVLEFLGKAKPALPAKGPVPSLAQASTLALTEA